MKTVYKLATLTLLMLVVTAYGFSQKPEKQKPATATQNLVRGLIGPFSSNNDWANYTLIDEIPGSALFPLTSSSTVFYFGFSAGTEADISNMVLYTTARGSLTITAVTPVTLGGVSNPSIILSNTSVCPVQPLSATNPCVVRFDPTSITLSATSDYYLAVYFTNDSNNSALGGVQPNNSAGLSLSGTYVGGVDDTHLSAGQSIPGATQGRPSYYLLYVMND